MDYEPKDLVQAQVTKANLKQDAGLKLIECRGSYIVSGVGSVFEMFTPLETGDRLIKLQDKDVSEYKNLDEIKKVLQDEKTISVEVVHRKNISDSNENFPNEGSENSTEDAEVIEQAIPHETK
jgi:hypothetical protein